MPCSEPIIDQGAADNRLVSRLICYLFPALGKEIPASVHVVMATDLRIGVLDSLGAHTELLCSTLKAMTPEELDRHVYDGRIRFARELADWWEKHQEIDRQRSMR